MKRETVTIPKEEYAKLKKKAEIADDIILQPERCRSWQNKKSSLSRFYDFFYIFFILSNYSQPNIHKQFFRLLHSLFH